MNKTEPRNLTLSGIILPVEVVQWIDDLAAEFGQSRSEVIEGLLSDALFAFQLEEAA